MEMERFKKKKRYDIADIAQSVAVGDFNNDMKLDIAVANNYDTSISILFGNGDGTFHDPIKSTTGSHPYFVTASDFNNDMKLDLAVTNDQDNNVAILLNSCP